MSFELFSRRLISRKKIEQIIMMARSQTARNVSTETTSDLMEKLRCLDTACLCDADKSLRGKQETDYNGLRVLQGLKPLNSSPDKVMVGVARTVQFKTPNDFFPVLQALDKAEADEILVANTLDSTRAVAGGLFASEAARKGLAGIVIDGPMRDVSSLQNHGVWCFSRSVTPYSGTVQSLGESQVDIECGGVQVSPGDILVGDDDGIVVASAATFEQILDTAQYIQAMEDNIMVGISNGHSLHSMTNYAEHLDALKSGKESALQLNGLNDSDNA